MKKLLIVSLLLLNASAWARSTEYTGVSATAGDIDTSVMRQNAYLWGADWISNTAVGADRRLLTDASGRLLTSSGGGGATTGVSVTSDTSPQMFALLTTTAALLATQNLAFGTLTFTANSRATTVFAPTTGTAITSVLITFTAKASILFNSIGALGVSFTVTNSSTPPVLSGQTYKVLSAGDSLMLLAVQGGLTSTDTWLHVSNLNALSATAERTW